MISSMHSGSPLNSPVGHESNSIPCNSHNESRSTPIAGRYNVTIHWPEWSSIIIRSRDGDRNGNYSGERPSVSHESPRSNSSLRPEDYPIYTGRGGVDSESKEPIGDYE